MDFSLLQQVSKKRQDAKKSVSSTTDATALFKRLFSQYDGHVDILSDECFSSLLDTADELFFIDVFENPFPDLRFCDLAKNIDGDK